MFQRSRVEQGTKLSRWDAERQKAPATPRGIVFSNAQANLRGGGTAAAGQKGSAAELAMAGDSGKAGILDTIEVLLASSDAEACSLLPLVLAQLPSAKIVGRTSTGRDFLNQMLSLSPNLVLLDLDSPQELLDVAHQFVKMRETPAAFIGLLGQNAVNGNLLSELDAVIRYGDRLDRVGDTVRMGMGKRDQKITGIAESGSTLDADTPAAPYSPQLSSADVAVEPALHQEAEPMAAPSEMQQPVEETQPLPTSEPRFSVDLAELRAGSPTTLVVYPFGSFRSLMAFQEALSQLQGVRNVKIRRFHQGTLYATIAYDGQIPLETRLLELAEFDPEVLESRPGNVHLRIDPGEGRVLDASTPD